MLIDSVLDVVRKEAKNCDCLQGLWSEMENARVSIRFIVDVVKDFVLVAFFKTFMRFSLIFPHFSAIWLI